MAKYTIFFIFENKAHSLPLSLSQKVESHSGTDTRPLTFRNFRGMPRIIEAVLPDISHISRLQNGRFIVQGFTEHHSLKKDNTPVSRSSAKVSSISVCFC